MWKPPTRREYNPKPMDPGQVTVWTVKRDGHWTIPARWDGTAYTPGAGEWIPEARTERIGTIWSEGSAPSTWWVLPDDDMLNPVIVRRAAKKHQGEYTEGELFQSTEGDGWRNAVRRAENVRSRGIFPVIEYTERGQYDYTTRQTRPGTHTVVWHTDQDCPDAAGKERFTGDSARNYRSPDYAVWTPADVARALMGLVQIGCSPTPFCARCIMRDTSLASQHSCASVTV